MAGCSIAWTRPRVSGLIATRVGLACHSYPSAMRNRDWTPKPRVQPETDGHHFDDMTGACPALEHEADGARGPIQVPGSIRTQCAANHCGTVPRQLG